MYGDYYEIQLYKCCFAGIVVMNFKTSVLYRLMILKLLFVVTNSGHAENKHASIPSTISINEVVKSCEIINKNLSGTKLSEVSAKLEYEIKPIIATKIKQYETVMSFFQEAFNDFTVKQSDVFFSGKTNILKQPEYNEPKKIKGIISKLENVELVKK